MTRPEQCYTAKNQQLLINTVCEYETRVVILQLDVYNELNHFARSFASKCANLFMVVQNSIDKLVPTNKKDLG